MPFTLPSALQSAIDFEVTNLCRIVELTRQDGVVLRLTDADADVRVGDNIYRADIGFTASALLVGANLNQAQGMTLTIALSEDGLTKNDIVTRRYDRGKVVYSICDYTDPNNTVLDQFEGTVGQASFTDTSEASVDVLPKTDDTVQFADEVYSQTCRASLGDGRCGFPIEAFAINFTITAVASRTQFTIDTFGPTAEGRSDLDYFAQGQLKFTSGNNQEWTCDVLSGDLSTKTLTIIFPLPEDAQVGDTGRLYPGCDKLLSTCKTKFDNVLNFRGEPDAPQWS